MANNTIRQNIIGYLYDLLKATADPVTGLALFNNVLKENLDDIDATQLPAVGMEEGEEEVIGEMYPCITKRLSIAVDFKFENKRGVDVYDEFNYYLGVLQNTLFVDRTMGSNGYDIQERGNAPQIMDRNDKRPGGVMYLEVYYKHRTADPYNIINQA